MTTPAQPVRAPIFEVYALPSHTLTPPSGTFLLCGRADILTWLQQTMSPGARYLEVRLLFENNELSNEENIAWEPFIRN
jgi:hypothetical protein